MEPSILCTSWYPVLGRELRTARMACFRDTRRKSLPPAQYATICISMSNQPLAFHAILSPMRWLFILHIACGTLALGILLLPLVSKKGGKLHVRAGWIYSLAMSAVACSAFLITPW